MFSRMIGLFLVAAFACLCAACGQQQISYSTDVQPLLEAHCAGCHSGGGEGESASGFSVASYDELMQGTRYGEMIVPGSAMSSTLFHMVAGTVDPAIQMPPHAPESLAEGRGEPLTDEQIQIIRLWIDQGAQDN